MEYALSLLIYIVQRWWLLLPLTLIVVYLLLRFDLVKGKMEWVLLGFLLVVLVFVLFSRALLAPVV